MKSTVILTMLISLIACGGGSNNDSNVQIPINANVQNISKFEESKFGSSSFN